jgi:hypothetical protein
MRSNDMSQAFRLLQSCAALIAAALLADLAPAAIAADGPGGGGDPPRVPCAHTIRADVVALDQVLVWNKFGSMDPNGMMFALKRDVVSQSGAAQPSPGDAMPRPLVLRVDAGDCLEVRFTNLLDPAQFSPDTPRTRSASFAVLGMSLLNIGSEGTNVGASTGALAAPGQTRTYTFVADTEGVHLARSMGAIAGGEGDGGSVSHGLFGAVIVEPAGSQWLDSVSGAPLLANGSIVSATPYAIVHGFADPTDAIEATSEGPFREFVVIFHDEAHTVHANPRLDTEFWLHGVRDTFGINYGISGVGEILLDALCQPDCRYEESFLTSWANGDPALLPQFANDPSNVWHSYLGDRVKIRNVHAGPKETHVFHLHAHQWVYSPNDPNSTYLDSQSIGPAAAFTYDIAYGGSGNRNMAPGDAIFHCHLYPHFAQGMWGLWRVHDVFEDGTRRLPDGTPIARIAPIPGLALPPLPTAALPGYPFFIPGAAGQWPVAGYPGNFKPGHRPPQPPLDMVRDGGLPRHLVVNGRTQGSLFDRHFAPGSMTRFAVVPPGGDVVTAGKDYLVLPQTGTRLEQNAMAMHSRRDLPQGIWGGIPSIVWTQPAVDPLPADYTAEGTAVAFKVNGLPGAPGAPFADPCPPGAPTRRYAVSAIDVDLRVNDTGWHDPQGRIAVLDGDVDATLAGTRPTEPLFFRANSNDCVVFEHTNRTRRELAQDAFQVRTPTDTIGQHIHLVKFDVLASDGSANGWNYEDATFARGEIQDRLAAMGFAGRHPNSTSTATFQTTAQRWWADPLLNGSGQDRTIRTVFTHDHFGPSSIQQHGYYAALVVEPQGSTWWHSETGTRLGTRADGGPTSWRADVVKDGRGTREFCLAVADYGIVYDERGNPVNPPRDSNGVITPEAISAADPGTGLFNYRNEPIPLRLVQSDAGGTTSSTRLAAGRAGRMPWVFDSSVHGDPATPLLSFYQGDNVQVRLIQGAQEESHAFKINRSKWDREVSIANSGKANAQVTGISEHFEMNQAVVAVSPARLNGNADRLEGVCDMLWSDASEDSLWNGMWGLLRVYGSPDANDPRTGRTPPLRPLPDNALGMGVTNQGEFVWPCPRSAPVRTYNVAAVTARSAIGNSGIVYNQGAAIQDDSGMLFVRLEDLDANGRLRGPVQPLVLRANAGDCLRINLTNMLPADRALVPDNPASDARMPPIAALGIADLRTDNVVGWSLDLCFGDALRGGDAAKIGFNTNQLIEPGASRQLSYYCGEVRYDRAARRLTAVPVAFGVCGVRGFGDVIKQPSQGLVAAVVVEPQGSTWTDPTSGQPAPTGAVAIVTNSSGGTLPQRFREFVLVQQDGLNLQQGAATNPLPDVADDAEDAGEKAFNYRTAPFWARLGSTFLSPAQLNDRDLGGVLAGSDPATPVFTAALGDRVVFRLTQPAGRQRAHTFCVQGHNWLDEPANPNSNVVGQQTAHSVGCNWNLVLREPAGGANRVAGDYLYGEVASYQFSQGLWGILRVR